MLKPSDGNASLRSPSFTPRRNSAIDGRLEAWCCAADLGKHPSQFAIPISKLENAGIQPHELQWALEKQLVELVLLPGFCASGLTLTRQGLEFFQRLPPTAGTSDGGNDGQ